MFVLFCVLSICLILYTCVFSESLSEGLEHAKRMLYTILLTSGLFATMTLILSPIICLIFINKEILIGNLTCDPELKYLPDKTALVEFELDYLHECKSKDGSITYMPWCVECQAFGKLAENINKYCREDHPLVVEGRRKYSGWVRADGSKTGKGGPPYIKVKGAHY